MLERSISERTVSSLPTIKPAWTYACLLFVWNHHLEHRERTLRSTYRFQEQGCMTGSPTLFQYKESAFSELEVLSADARKKIQRTADSVTSSDMHEWYI